MPGTNHDILSPEQAHALGRQLGEHPLLAGREGHERPEVAEVLSDAAPLLNSYGVSLEIVRTRPTLVVLRARGQGRTTPPVACEMVKGLLSTVPDQACGVKASLVENTCAQRGASACVFSLMWEEPTAHRAPPPPEALLDHSVLDHSVTSTWELTESMGALKPPLSDERANAALLQAGLEAYAPPLPPTGASVRSDQPNAATELFERSESVPSVPLVSPSPGSMFPEQFATSTPNPVVASASFPKSSDPTPVPAPQAALAQDRSHIPPIRVRRSLLRGLLRRGWLLALALVAGSAGGWFAGVHASVSYGAQAILLVQSGASKAGPGGANDALALATTYSAVIPKDQAVLNTAAASLGISPSAVGGAIDVTVETGTSLLQLTFSASNPTQAVKGAKAVARAVADTTQLTAAIPAGSVAIVSVPTSAHRQGTLHKYGIVLGAFLGLVVGLILVLAAERADPRIDDSLALATITGCRAASVPDELSYPELARVLSDAGRGDGLTVVPMAVADTAPTMELARQLRPRWPADGPAVAISPSFSSGVVELSRGSGPTVLVSHPGARQREILAAAERLKMINRPPVWAILANRRLRGRRSGRVD